jgi:hypothetical protein
MASFLSCGGFPAKAGSEHSSSCAVTRNDVGHSRTHGPQECLEWDSREGSSFVWLLLSGEKQYLRSAVLTNYFGFFVSVGCRKTFRLNCSLLLLLCRAITMEYLHASITSLMTLTLTNDIGLDCISYHDGSYQLL